jgi:hypothetical protein
LSEDKIYNDLQNWCGIPKAAFKPQTFSLKRKNKIHFKQTNNYFNRLQNIMACNLKGGAVKSDEQRATRDEITENF